MRKPFLQYLFLSGIFLFLTSGYGFGQEKSNIPVVIPPSPNAASLGKFGDIPVSPYTGVPGIDIPIYEIVSGDIKVPVSISYHGSGIKVAEEAGRVGLGWSLNAGGVISRSIYGQDDFIFPKYFDTTLPELPEGPLKGPKVWSQTGNKPLMYDGSAEYNLDLSKHITTSSEDLFQPDQYSYNFNGHSGKFVLKRNKEVVLSKQDKISIKFPDADANSWEVISSDGFKYLFETYETYTDNSLTTSGVPHTHKSSWYLTKIISPTGSVVTFKYTIISGQYIKPVGAYSETQQSLSVPVSTCPYTCSTLPPQAGRAYGKEYSIVMLESIDFDNGQMLFNYEAREDLEGDKRLKSIQVFQKTASGTRITPAAKTFTFGYDYFNSTLDKDYVSDGPLNYVTKRLKLLSLQEFSGSDATKSKKPHLFRYNEGTNQTNLPAKTSFARDHWGYFNGKFGNTSLIPVYEGNNSTDPVRKLMGNMLSNRATDPLYVGAFSLKEIEYPTQGKTILEFEGHTFDVEKSRVQDDSFMGDAPALEQTYKRMMHSNGNNGTVIQKELDLTDIFLEKNATTAQVTLSAGIRLSTSCKDVYVSSGDGYFELYTPEGGRVSQVTVGSMSCGGQVYEYTNSYHLKPGKYIWKAFISASNTTIMDISASYGYFREKGVEAPGAAAGIYDFAGGLRIKRITDQDDVSGQKIIKKYEYHYKEDRNADGIPEVYSYGLRMAVPQYTYFDLVQEKKSYATIPVTDYCYCARMFRTSDSSIPLNGSASGSVVGYNQVEVLYGENGENGKTKFEYENRPDQILNYFMYGFPMRPSPVPNIPYAKNGMMNSQTDFANNNGVFTAVKTVVNQNVSVDERVIYGIDKRNHTKLGQPGDETTGTGGTTADPLLPNELDVFFYPSLKSSRTYVAKTTETTIPATGTPFITETEYLYENKAHLQPTTIITTIDHAKKQIEKIKYPADFSATTANALIEEMKGVRHMHDVPLERTTLVREAGVDKITAKTVYEFGLFGTFLQKKTVYAIETNEPLVLTAVPAYDPKATTPNAAYKSKVRYSYYDNGNIREVMPFNQPAITYLWSYSNKLPIAEIKNATFLEVDAAIKLSPVIVLEGLAGAPLDDVTLRSRIELLRQRLPQALISSYTFKPLEGVTSFTDPAGNVTLFGYDPLDRLQLVKDHDGNIIKTYEYNYRHY